MLPCRCKPSDKACERLGCQGETKAARIRRLGAACDEAYDALRAAEMAVQSAEDAYYEAQHEGEVR
jgi:hypothetical protein